jgi:hypothetical protein
MPFVFFAFANAVHALSKLNRAWVSLDFMDFIYIYLYALRTVDF